MDQFDFLKTWKADNVTKLVPGPQMDAEAELLAERCLAAAASQGINREALEEAAAQALGGADLIAYMRQALDDISWEVTEGITKNA